MAVKQRSATQTVTHTNQLRPSMGHSATLVAEDGDSIALRWDGTRWVSDVVADYSDTFKVMPVGYMNENSGGGDAFETILAAGGDHVFLVNDPIGVDNYYPASYNLRYSYTQSIKTFEVQKWVKAGLQLAGRVQASVVEDNSEADTLHIGPGINSYTHQLLEQGGEYAIFAAAYNYTSEQP